MIKYSFTLWERITGYLLTIPFILLFLLILTLSAIPWFADFNEIVYWSREKLPAFQNTRQGEAILFSQSGYAWSRYISLILWAMAVAGVAFCGLNWSKIRQGIMQLGKVLVAEVLSCLRVLKEMPRMLTWIIPAILAVSFVARILQYNFVLPHIDELTSYEYFARNGLSFTMVYYPMPNNHIFFNMLYAISTSVIGDYLLAGRIINLFAFYLAALILFLGLVRISGNYWSGTIALMAVLLLMPSSVYSLMGRGYMLTILFGIIAWFALQKGLESSKSGYFILFIMSGVLGCYTIPVFILPIGSMVIYLGFHSIRHSMIRETWWVVPVMAFGVLLCYLPVMLFNGPGALFSNEFVSQSLGMDFWSVYKILMAEILSFLNTVSTKGWFIFLITVAMIPFIYNRLTQYERNFLVITALIYGIFVVFPLVSGITLPIRALTMISFFWYGYMAVLTGIILNHLKTKHAYAALTVILLIVVYRAWDQYRSDPFTSILPNESRRTYQALLENCVAEEGKAFVNTSNEFVHLHMRYLVRNKGLILTNDMQAATYIILDERRVHEFDIQEVVRQVRIGIMYWQNENVVLIK